VRDPHPHGLTALPSSIGRLHIRPIRGEDLPAITAVLPPAPFRTHADDLDWQSTGAVTVLIAWLDDTPVASGLIHWNGPRDVAVADLMPGCPEIFRLEVLGQYRSKGIGSAMIGELEALALAGGFRRIGLGVGTANHRARLLYERLGYRLIDGLEYLDRSERPDSNGQPYVHEEPCVFMVREFGSVPPGSPPGIAPA
jgi:GNAT superfamily N-acetyltransferase